MPFTHIIQSMRGLIWLLIAIAATVPLASGQTPTPLIVDTDIGDDVDDALALALLLQSPEVDIRLVSTVSDDVESRTRLLWKELGVYGRQDIAVATGASKPLDDPAYPSHSPQFAILTPEDQAPEAARRNATEAIAEALKQSPRPVTILALGPLTNIALVLRSDPQVKEKIARIVMMGGAYFRQKREYDISRDRVAADVVFRSGVPITAVGLDVTDFFRLESQFVEQIRDAHNAGSDFLYRLIELWQEGDGGKLPVLYDPVTAAAVLKPSLIQTMSGTVEVEMHDPAFLGVTRFTRADGESRGPVDVARGVTAVELIELFMDRVTAPPRTKKR